MTMNVKKKRVSKKTKSSWRKHTNVQDVDEFLEEQRLEERLGKFDTLTNEELFQVDSTPLAETLSKKEKIRLELQALPKCFSMLKSHTNVPDPITKRNRVRTKEERTSSILRKKEQERKSRGIFKAKELQSMRDRRLYIENKRNQSKPGDFNIDIWSAEETGDKIGSQQNEWVEKVTVRHNLRGLGRLKKVAPIPVNTKKPVGKSIEAPHPGTSYNPSFEDHQKLLQEIAEKESQIIKEEKHINRVTSGMFTKVTIAKKNATWFEEMSEGLPKLQQQQQEEEQKSETEQDDKPYISVNPPTKNKKKTLKQRRKQREQIKLEEAKKCLKMEKKKRADLYKLKFINEEIRKREDKLGKQREKYLKSKTQKMNETKRLSKLKYEEPDVEFNMGEDISGNLRNMKKEGSLLHDRFKSMQKRNIIQVTARQNRKKAKVKKYRKPGFKEDWKSAK